MTKRALLRRASVSAAVVAMALGSTSAVPQTRPMPLPSTPEATIYRDNNYSGPAVAIQSEEPDLGLNWRVSSIRVPAGEWQLCSRPNYGGDCFTVDKDRPRLGLFGTGVTVQSARLTGGGQRPEPGNGGESLRGMASQYFTLPMLYGQTVLACRGSATAACAAQTAGDFCRQMGWRVSLHQRMETQSGRVVLRDVLCSNAAM